MRKLVKEISVIPGVAGSFIFDKNEGTLCSELDWSLPNEFTREVGMHFVRLIQMGGMNKLQINSAQFRFDRYSLVGLPLEKGAILLVVCSAQANYSLVATTAAMLIQDMQEELKREFSVPVAGEGALAQESSVVAPAEISSDLRPYLNKIEEALVTAIGPVAAMVMADHLNRWRTSGPAEKDRLTELISMLTSEIDDAVLAEDFKTQLQSLV